MTMQDKDLVRQLLALLVGDDNAGNVSDDDAWQVGDAYLIRTVTFSWTGRIVKVTDQELVLKDAAWIADTGRYSEATTADALNEVEPVESGRVIIGRGSIVDARRWMSNLPRSAK